MQHPRDTLLLKSLENLIVSTQDLKYSPAGIDQQPGIDYTLRCLGRLADMVLGGRPVFDAETWHVVADEANLDAPAELLLRIKNRNGEVLSPYLAVMTLYENGMAPMLDKVLFLAAFREFRAKGHKQLSINVSTESLRDPDFVRTILPRIDEMKLCGDEKIIIEIHESSNHLSINPLILKMFRKSGVLFAIDDVGLSIQDVFRLSEFEGIADYVKIDRHCVSADDNSSVSLKKVLSFVRSTLPEAQIVAEGVRDIAHVCEVQEHHPEIQYVQGVYLPRRHEFKAQMERIRKRRIAGAHHDMMDRFQMAAGHDGAKA